MKVKTRYGVKMWWAAMTWWLPRSSRKAARTALSLPKALYYSARGGSRETS